MFCHNCGSRQTDEASFCAQCGARQIPDTPEPLQPADSALAKGETASPVRDSRNSTEARLVPGTTSPLPVQRSRGIRTSTVVFWLFTVTWVSLVSLHAYANWLRLSKLEPGGIWDFVIRATAPVVLFWLVTRYFQLAARLRNADVLNLQAAQLVAKTQEASETMTRLARQAQTAVDRVEAEIEKLRDQEKARVRAVQPRWEVNGRIAHEKVHEINLRNAGAAATSLSAAWDKSLRMAVILSDTTFVDRGGNLTIKAMFLDERIDDFDLKLHYNDGANEARVAHITVSNMEVAIRQDEV